MLQGRPVRLRFWQFPVPFARSVPDVQSILVAEATNTELVDQSAA
jgi:hypothetical protein